MRVHPSERSPMLPKDYAGFNPLGGGDSLITEALTMVVTKIFSFVQLLEWPLGAPPSASRTWGSEVDPEYILASLIHM